MSKVSTQIYEHPKKAKKSPLKKAPPLPPPLPQGKKNKKETGKKRENKKEKEEKKKKKEEEEEKKKKTKEKQKQKKKTKEKDSYLCCEGHTQTFHIDLELRRKDPFFSMLLASYLDLQRRFTSTKNRPSYCC